MKIYKFHNIIDVDSTKKLYLGRQRNPHPEDTDNVKSHTENGEYKAQSCHFVTGVVLFAMTIFCISCVLLALDWVLSPVTRARSQQAKQATVISCYYNTPDRSNATLNQLLPSDIHPLLCTHLNVAFAQVVNKQIHLEQSQCETLREVVLLKRANPQLKVLLSVGGTGENNGFSEMVTDHASRKVFIKSIKSILRNYSLDGVDLDWEFPALHGEVHNLAVRERQHFSQLLREIRMEYIREKKDYLLTVAVAAPQTIVDVAYDVDQINLYVDFANIMTYDFHYYTKFTPFTGFNSPLYARANEGLYLATLNINYTVQMYTTKGLDKSKIVVGIPTYGHTFKLVNPNNPNVGSPASSYGSLGGHGFVNYPEVCSFWESGNVTEQYDTSARVPYLYRGQEWVSYDSPQSVMDKADYIKTNQLRGAMIYSLNADDFEGACGARGGGKFPLAQCVRRVLRGDRRRWPRALRGTRLEVARHS